MVEDYYEKNRINDLNAKTITLDDCYYDYEEERLVDCCGQTRKRKYKYKNDYEKYTPKFEKFKHFIWPPYKPKFKLLDSNGRRNRNKLHLRNSRQ